MKRTAVRLAIFVPGLLYVLEWLTAGTPLNRIPGTPWSLTHAVNVMATALVVIAAFAYGVGMVNVFRTHTLAVLQRRQGWAYSVIVFVSFISVLAVCVWWGWVRPATGARAHDPLQFFITYINTPLVATVMALLAFYITYAAYRAFRVRSAESIVMMSVAVIVMLGYDPAGNWLTRGLHHTIAHNLQLPVLAQFMMQTINSAVFRALNLGIAIATIAMAWRIWLGLDKEAAGL